MKEHFRLGDAANTHNPALIVLADKGYHVYIIPPEEDEPEAEFEIGFWCAEKNGREFWAENPLTLLGLVALWEHRGDNWRSDDDPYLYDEIITATYGDD